MRDPDDPLDAVLEKIRIEFERRHGPSRVNCAFDELEWNGIKIGPGIGFIETGGNFGKPAQRGPRDTDEDATTDNLLAFGSIGTMYADVEVRCFAKPRSAARQLLFEVYQASLQIPDRVAWTNYDRSDDAHREGGDIFTGRLRIELPIPAETTHSVAVKPMRSYELATTSQGATVNQEFDLDA